MALLRHLALRCRDVETSRTFYEKILGFEFVGYRGQGTAVDLSDGTSNITLLPHEGDRPVLAEGEEYIHFGIIVENLEGVWRSLREFGSVVEKTVKSREDIDSESVPEIAFKTIDPDGNVIDVTNDPEEWRGTQM